MRAEDRDFFELVILMKKIVLLLLVGPDKSVTLLDSFTHFRVDAAFAGIEAGQRNFFCLEKTKIAASADFRGFLQHGRFDGGAAEVT